MNTLPVQVAEGALIVRWGILPKELLQLLAFLLVSAMRIVYAQRGILRQTMAPLVIAVMKGHTRLQRVTRSAQPAPATKLDAASRRRVLATPATALRTQE